MKLNRENLLEAVNGVMGQMYYLSPDLDEWGRQQLDGAAPAEGVILRTPISESLILQWIYEWELLQLMTANLTALPPDELPKDWIRQAAREASWVTWGRYLTLHRNKSQERIDMIVPQPSEERIDITGATWEFNFIAESHRLSVSLIEIADL